MRVCFSFFRIFAFVSVFVFPVSACVCHIVFHSVLFSESWLGWGSHMDSERFFGMMAKFECGHISSFRSSLSLGMAVIRCVLSRALRVIVSWAGGQIYVVFIGGSGGDVRLCFEFVGGPCALGKTSFVFAIPGRSLCLRAICFCL